MLCFLRTGFLRVSIAASALFAPLNSSAQCGGKCEWDEYLSGMDAQFCYCTKYADRKSLDHSMRAIDAAAAAPGCIGGDYCNFFVARIARTRNVAYFRDVLFPGSLPNDIGGPDEVRRANELYEFIARAVRSKPSGWRQLSEEEAQQLANRGKFVIGTARSFNPASSGHVAVVAPSQMTKAGAGTGPWVRDAQNPMRSIKASQRFGSSVVAPIWAVWEHDTD